MLAERELAKIAALTVTLAHALQARGSGELIAGIAAHTAMGVFTHATVAWLADPQLSLDERLSKATAALRELGETFGDCKAIDPCHRKRA